MIKDLIERLQDGCIWEAFSSNVDERATDDLMDEAATKIKELEAEVEALRETAQAYRDLGDYARVEEYEGKRIALDKLLEGSSD